MEAKDVTKTELKKVAKELNEQLGLEPPILLDMKVTALKTKCMEAAALIDPEEDEFSDEVWEVLGALGAASRPDTDGDVIEGEDADEAVAEAMGDTLVADFQNAKKLVDLKELAGAWECFEKLDLDQYSGLQGPKKLRAAMLDCLPDELREQIEPKPVEKTEGLVKKTSKPKWKAVIEVIVANPEIDEAGVAEKLKAEGLTMASNTIGIYLREVKYALSCLKK